MEEKGDERFRGYGIFRFEIRFVFFLIVGCYVGGFIFIFYKVCLGGFGKWGRLCFYFLGIL